MANLEAQRQAEIERTKAELSSKGEQALKAGLKDVEQIAKIRGDEPESADVRYQRALAEFEENMMNREARAGESVSEAFTEAELIKYSPEYRQLADFLGIRAMDIGDYAQQLAVIMGWGKETSGKASILEVMLAVKDLKRSLGFQEVGPTGLKKLYQYIRLDLDTKRLRESSEENKSSKLKEIKQEKELLT